MRGVAVLGVLLLTVVGVCCLLMSIWLWSSSDNTAYKQNADVLRELRGDISSFSKKIEDLRSYMETINNDVMSIKADVMSQQKQLEILTSKSNTLTESNKNNHKNTAHLESVVKDIKHNMEKLENKAEKTKSIVELHVVSAIPVRPVKVKKKPLLKDEKKK